MSLGPRSLAAALLLACACSSKPSKQPIHDAAPPPPPAPVPVQPAARLPPPAPIPNTVIGRGQEIDYPELVPLVIRPGVAAPEPPLRVQALLPVPERRLAIASGTSATSSAGSSPAVALVDLERATIAWIDTTSCEGPVVHVSSDRVICAGWKGIRALDVNSGRVIWESTLMYRAADRGYVVGRDPGDATRGQVVDVATGRVLTQVIAPAGRDLEEIRRICPEEGGFDLFYWSDTGQIARLSVPPHSQLATLVWTRELGQEPARASLCDSILLIETPIPGRAMYRLHALAKKNGAPVAPAMEVLGTWPAQQPGEIVVSTPAGLEVRTRKLGDARLLTANRVGDQLVASWGDLRLVRSVAGTLLVLDSQGVSHWLAAPAHAGQAVLTPTHVLAGPWLGNPRSTAETLALYRLPPEPSEPRKRGFDTAPSPPVSRPLVTDGRMHRMPPTGAVAGITVPFPQSGEHAVQHVALAGERLYVAASSDGSAARDVFLAAFDLRVRAWRWHRAQACTGDAGVAGIAITEAAVACAVRAHYPGKGSVQAFTPDTGEPLWNLELATVDAIMGGGEVIVVLAGSRAIIVDAASGRVRYELEADNGHVPRAIVAAGRVIAVERGGVVVAREPDGTPIWSAGVHGYIQGLYVAGDTAAVHTDSGELFLLAAASGAVQAAPAGSSTWTIPGGGDLAFDDARGRPGEVVLRAYGLNGSERFRATYFSSSAWELVALRGTDAATPVGLLLRQGEPRLLHIDPRTGEVLATHLLPARAYARGAFATAIAGRPLTGVLLEKPLAVQLYELPGNLAQ